MPSPVQEQLARLDKERMELGRLSVPRMICNHNVLVNRLHGQAPDGILEINYEGA